MKSHSLIASLSALLLALPLAAQQKARPVVLDVSVQADEFYFPTTGVTVRGQALLLGIDNYLLPLRENVSLYLSKPKARKEPVLAPSKDDPLAPDQVASHFYGAVINDNGKFRMWYYACALKEPGDAYNADVSQLLQGPVCYAESDDGIKWVKPKLNQVEVRGSTANNAVFLPDEKIETVSVIKDESDPDPNRRYKMLYNPHNGTTWVLRTATSPDGIRWTAAKNFAIDQFLEPAGMYKFNGMYFVGGQRTTPSEGGALGARQGKTLLSTNFDTWIPGDAEGFHIVEPVNPADRGHLKSYDQVHLGVGGASFGNVVIGLYGMWHNQAGNNRDQERWGWFGYGKISCDLGLVISNDGMHFREPDKGRVYISRLDAPATPVPGHDYPTILTQSGNGILNVGDETRIYFGRWMNAEYGKGYSGEVGLATLPRDRWGALGLYPEDAKTYQKRGSVWSAPVRIPASGCELFLNADNCGNMTVEISDTKFQLLPDYSGARAGKSGQSGGIDCAVSWRGGKLSELAEKTVRFKMNFEAQPNANPRLYAVTLRSK